MKAYNWSWGSVLAAEKIQSLTVIQFETRELILIPTSKDPKGPKKSSKAPKGVEGSNEKKFSSPPIIVRWRNFIACGLSLSNIWKSKRNYKYQFFRLQKSLLTNISWGSKQPRLSFFESKSSRLGYAQNYIPRRTTFNSYPSFRLKRAQRFPSHFCTARLSKMSVTFEYLHNLTWNEKGWDPKPHILGITDEIRWRRPTILRCLLFQLLSFLQTWDMGGSQSHTKSLFDDRGRAKYLTKSGRGDKRKRKNILALIKGDTPQQNIESYWV